MIPQLNQLNLFQACSVPCLWGPATSLQARCLHYPGRFQRSVEQFPETWKEKITGKGTLIKSTSGSNTFRKFFQGAIPTNINIRAPFNLEEIFKIQAMTGSFSSNIPSCNKNPTSPTSAWSKSNNLIDSLSKVIIINKENNYLSFWISVPGVIDGPNVDKFRPSMATLACLSGIR